MALTTVQDFRNLVKNGKYKGRGGALKAIHRFNAWEAHDQATARKWVESYYKKAAAATADPEADKEPKRKAQAKTATKPTLETKAIQVGSVATKIVPKKRRRSQKDMSNDELLKQLQELGIPRDAFLRLELARGHLEVLRGHLEVLQGLDSIVQGSGDKDLQGVLHTSVKACIEAITYVTASTDDAPSNETSKAAITPVAKESKKTKEEKVVTEVSSSPAKTPSVPTPEDKPKEDGYNPAVAL